MIKFLFMTLLFLLASCASYNPAKLDHYLTGIRYLYSVGEWHETVAAIETLEKNSYYSDDLVIMKARCEWQLGDSDGALEILKTALEKTPHSESITLELVNLLMDLNRNLEANELALRVFERGNPSHKSRKLLGFSYMKLGEWARAQATLAPLYVTNDEEAIFWYGQSFYKQGNYEAAVPVFEKSFQFADYQKRAAQYLAWIHTSLKHVTEANNYIRYLILVDPKDFYAQKIYTKNVLNLTHSDKVTILRLFNENFKDEWGQFQYFDELRKAGLKEDALNYISTLWNKNPGSVWIASHYADELHKTGDTELAKSVLDKSLSLVAGNSAQELQNELAKIDSATINPTRNIANLVRTYQVQSGDTLQSISLKLFKTTKYWSNIQFYNKHLVPQAQDLRVGIVLQIPEVL